jgi:hypothetical protein
VGAKASGAQVDIERTLMAGVFEDKISIMRPAKLDLLVYTDEIGSAGAAMPVCPAFHNAQPQPD